MIAHRPARRERCVPRPTVDRRIIGTLHRMPYPARFYAALHRGSPGDLAHYQRVCRGASSVLELGCGSGRVLAALAAPGRRVVGVDRDPEQLALAEETLRDLDPEHRRGIELIEGAMESISLGERFDRVLVPFGGLWCLLDDAALHATLRTIVDHLAPGGRVAFDGYRADEFHHEAEPDDVPEDAHTPLTRVEVDGVAYEVLERSTWDKPRQRIDVSYLYVDEAGRGVEGTIAQRYLLEPQLRAALERVGLTIVRLDGGFVVPDHEAERDDTNDHASGDDEEDVEDEEDEQGELMIVEAIRSS